jgi:uncharacterized GH25 family protein
MVTVHLIRLSDGKPICGASVYISRQGSGILDFGGVFGSEKTDQNGQVSFWNLDLPAWGKVVVDGREVHDDQLQKIMIFTL